MRENRSAAGNARLLTLQQASREFGPPYTSLRDLVIRGHLPGVRLGDGRRIWVRRTDLERLVERSTG
jgi:excisionase family DNA binding protein